MTFFARFHVSRSEPVSAEKFGRKTFFAHSILNAGPGGIEGKQDVSGAAAAFQIAF